MKRIMLLLMLLMVGATAGLEIQVDAPTQIEIGQNWNATLAATLQEIPVLSISYQVEITDPNGVTRKISPTALGDGRYLIDQEVDIPGRWQYAISTQRSENETKGSFTVTSDTTRYDLNALPGENALTDDYNALAVGAQPAEIYQGALPQQFNLVQNDQKLSITPILGTNQLMIINSSLVILDSVELTQGQQIEYEINLQPGKYFLLMTGQKRYITPIQVEGEVRQPQNISNLTSVPITSNNTKPTTITAGKRIFDSDGNAVNARVEIKNYTGLSRVSATTTGKRRTIEITPNEGFIDTLTIHAGIPQNFAVGMENIENQIASTQIGHSVSDAFAINPQFDSSYTINKIATGTRLLACTDYDFNNQRCTGEFKVVAETIPGQPYSVTLTPEDPLFVEDSWWNTSFTACKNIDVRNIGGSDLVDFPAYLEIPYDDDMNSNLSDLRFVNASCAAGGELMDHYVEFSNSSLVSAHVKIPMHASSGSNISVYYSNPTATTIESSSNTFSASYGLAYSMDGSGNDLTGNGRDVVSISGTNTTNGTVGFGRNFDGISDEYDQTDLAYWEVQWDNRAHEIVFTTSDDINTRQAIYAEGGGTNGIMLYILSGDLYARWWSETDGWGGNSLNVSIAENTTYHSTMRLDYVGNYEFQVNGALIGSGNAPSGIASHTGNGAVGSTGDTKDFDDASTTAFFEGVINEFRILDDTKSRDWFNVSYDLMLNQSAAVTIGDETGPVPTVEEAAFIPDTINITGTSILELNVTDPRGSATVREVNATIQAPNGTNKTYQLEQVVINDQTGITPDAIPGTEAFLSTDGTYYLGEVGSINITNGTAQEISFNRNYPSTPIIMAVSATQDNGFEAGLIAYVIAANTTHATINLCQDSGSTTCRTDYGTEEVHYMVFDEQAADEFDWIDVGTAVVGTDGNIDTVNFEDTFSSTPYVFFTYQEDATGGTNLKPTTWADSVGTASVDVVGCIHDGSSDNCVSGGTAEVGFVAIDPINQNITNLQNGTEAISDSTYTSVTFSPNVTNPRIMVGVNSEGGGQDPAYPMARNVTPDGAEIRYCEQDGFDDCDTHNPETTRWIVIPDGDIVVIGPRSVEDTTAWFTFDQFGSTNVLNISALNISLQISDYDGTGSANNSNTPPNLEIQISNGTGTYLNITDVNITSTGTYVFEIFDNNTQEHWELQKNRQVRIRGINLDFNTTVINDSIQASILQASYVFDNETKTWRYNLSGLERGLYELVQTTATNDINFTREQNITDVNLTVENILPTHTPPILNATTIANYTEDNLTVYNQSTQDFENDSIVNVIDWRINGGSLAQINIPFENSSNPFMDVSTNNYSYSNNQTNLIQGRIGKAANFTSGNHINYSNFTPSSSATVSFWMYNHSTPGSRERIFGIDDDYELRFETNGLLHFDLCIGGGNNDFATTTNVWDSQQWYHIAATYDDASDEYAVYVNGVLDKNGTTAMDCSGVGGNFTLGTRHGTGEYFQGRLDEFRVYNRSLSQEQILLIVTGNDTTIASNTTQTGENWSACISPNDGFGYGQTLCSNIIEISGEREANLTALDEQEYLGAKTYAGQPLAIFANWTYSTSPITSGTCEAALHDGRNLSMNYDAVTQLWTAQTTYYLEGIITYNVTCDSPDYFEASDADNASIQSVINLSAAIKNLTSTNDNVYNVVIEVQNRQNYTERNISVILNWPNTISIVANQSIQSTLDNGVMTTYEWSIPELNPGNSTEISVNATGTANYNPSPKLAISSSTESDYLYT